MSMQGSSLAEARELYEVLQDCTVVLDRVETRTRQNTVSMTKLLVITNSLLIALDKAGYGTDFEDTVAKIRFLIMFLQRLQMVVVATNIAMASGPAGMFLGALTIGLTAYSSIDMAGSVI